MVVSAEVAALVQRSWDMAMVPGGAAGHVISPLLPTLWQRRGSVVSEPRRDQARRSSTSRLMGSLPAAVWGLKSSVTALPDGPALPHKFVQQPQTDGRHSFGDRGSLDRIDVDTEALLPSLTGPALASEPAAAATTGQLPLNPIGHGLHGSGRMAAIPLLTTGPGEEEAAAVPVSVGPGADAAATNPIVVEDFADSEAMRRRMAAALRMLVPGCVRGLIEDNNLDFINE